MDFFKQLTTEIKNFFERLSNTQRIIFVSVVSLIIITAVIIISLSNKESFSPLFTNLEYEDMNSIIEQLKSEKIPYKLENNGRIVLVPSDKVYELRISLSAKGLPKNSQVGYEIFDKTNLGTTETLQKIQYKRALEGELIRTIEGIEGVEAARVHLVLPKQALFEEDQKPTTASIYLKLSRRNVLNKKQVDAIVHLVSTSVEGLKPENITVMDSFGNLLSEKTDETYMGHLTGTQLELQKSVEKHYKNKVEDLLAGVLGKGKVKVSVSVQLDFDQIETTKEEYNPAVTAIRSQEQHKEESNVTGDTKEKSIINYEINKTVQHIVNSVGSIKKLTTAVLVDGVYTVDKEGKTQYQPRDKTELGKLTEIVKRAVGFDKGRGDEVIVENLQFDRSEIAAELAAMEQAKRSELIKLAVKYGVLIVLVIIVLFAAFKIVKILLPKPVELPSEEEFINKEEEELLETEEILAEYKKGKEPTKEDKRHFAIIQELKTISMENPKEVVQLLRTWMISEKEE